MSVTWTAEQVANWLYDTLEPDTALRAALGGTGRVFDTMPPQYGTSAAAPDTYVLFQHQSGVPMVCLGPTRPGEDFVFTVKVVSRTQPFSAMAAALARIEALLYGVDVTVGSWRFQQAERPETSLTLRYVEPSTGGPVYRHAGRQWPISVYPAA